MSNFRTPWPGSGSTETTLLVRFVVRHRRSGWGKNWKQPIANGASAKRRKQPSSGAPGGYADLPAAAHAGRSGRSPDRPRRPSLALDPGQAVLDPGLRPGTPRHGEELEPLLDEEVRVHLGRDEIHASGDAALCGGCPDFIERSLIGVAGGGEGHPPP